MSQKRTYPDRRLQKYYEEGNYRGFHIKGEEKVYKLMGVTHLIFTNGDKELFSSGIFSDEAYLKMFDQIDKYYRKN